MMMEWFVVLINFTLPHTRTILVWFVIYPHCLRLFWLNRSHRVRMMDRIRSIRWCKALHHRSILGDKRLIIRLHIECEGVGCWDEIQCREWIVKSELISHRFIVYRSSMSLCSLHFPLLIWHYLRPSMTFIYSEGPCVLIADSFKTHCLKHELENAQ